MNPNPQTASPASPATVARRSRRRMFISLFLWCTASFWSAGSLAWGRGWLMLAVMALAFRITQVYLSRVNPAVLAARQQNTRPSTRFDRIILPVFVILIYVTPAVAGHDAARHHGAPLHALWIPPGIALYAAGIALIVWAMAVNPFLEPTVRIQAERGHHVISGGPYRFVRHPMYDGCCLLFAGIPLILGSRWAFLPAAGAALALVVRTFFEDRLLRSELPGYEDFTRRTRWRLLPGLW